MVYPIAFILSTWIIRYSTSRNLIAHDDNLKGDAEQLEFNVDLNGISRTQLDEAKVGFDQINLSDAFLCNKSLLPSEPILYDPVPLRHGHQYKLTWSSNPSEQMVHLYSVTVRQSVYESGSPIIASSQVYEVLAELFTGRNISISISRLKPQLEYELWVSARNIYGEGKKSISKIFKVESSIMAGSELTEYLLVAFVIVGWLLLLYLFFRQWGAIKNLQPRETRYKQTISNEKDVRVVEKEKESVIQYKEPRASKIARFKKMREFRLSQIKRPSWGVSGDSSRRSSNV